MKKKKLFTKPLILGMGVLFMGLVASATWASAEMEVRIVIKDHKFDPAEVRVPAETKIKLIVVNEDASAEEFESHSLNREKIIRGGKTATIKLPKLKPGKYDFFGEFHPDTAQGVIIAE